MSLSLNINPEDHASNRLKLLEGALRNNRASLHQYIADSCVSITRNLFAEMGAKPNSSNWKPTGFWRRMAAGTVAVATTDAAIVRMPREVAQRYFGGTIYPTGGHRFLALPAREEAYGKSPREFDNLTFVPTGTDKGMLVEKAGEESYGRKFKDGSRRTRDTGGGAFFFLVQSVWQAANSSVLPTDAEYLTAANAGVAAYLDNFL